MGDISEMRGLITTFCFIGCFVFIIALIPPQLMEATYEGRTVEIPTYFEALDLLYYVDTVNLTLDDSGEFRYGSYWYPIVVGGHNLEVIDEQEPELWVRHYWYFWIFPTAHHFMSWSNKMGESRGDSLLPSELDSDYEEGNIKYRVSCNDFQMDIFFGFNETLYSSPSEAWENNDLRVLFAVEFDQVNTSINAWSLISMLLFFQLPDIHWVINVFIALPFWIAFAYLAFIFILRTVGAVFGGGGA